MNMSRQSCENKLSQATTLTMTSFNKHIFISISYQKGFFLNIDLIPVKGIETDFKTVFFFFFAVTKM